MRKLAYTQVQKIASVGASALRYLSMENKDLREKVAHFQLLERCRGIARTMGEKGLNPGFSEEEKVAQLIQQAQSGRLDAIEEAVGMTADQGVFPATLEDAERRVAGAGESAGVGENLFITHLLGE